MKAVHLAALALLTALGAGVSHASLGDTEARCIAKYGSEFDVTDDLGDRVVGDRAATFYTKTASGSLTLRVVFLHGTVAHEAISSTDPSQPLSEPQMKALLDAESAGLEWRKRNTILRTDSSGSTYGSVNWLRSDGVVATFWVTGQAGLQDLSGQMEISTKVFADAQAFYDKENGAN